MAQFFDNPGAQPPASERRVRRALEQLDDSWRVFHSVAWQSIRNGRQGDGEADFVLMHPRNGMVVLEVKGGRIEVDEGRWFSRDREGVLHAIKNPYEQARASKYALLAFLNAVEPQLARVGICYAVVFPDVSTTEPIGLFPRETLLDSDDLSSPRSAIERLLKHWGQFGASILSPNQISSLTRRFSPTLSTRRRLKQDLDSAGEEIIELTQRQVEVLSGLRRARRCIVQGGAGTGKTVLAIEKARQLAADGARVLLTCYNAPLAERIKVECAANKGIDVTTFHSLCVRRARKAGSSIPRNPSDAWWDEDAAALLRETKSHDPYDAVVIDEAQDFSEHWISALESLLREPRFSPLFAFGDSHQQVYRRHWSPPEHWLPFDLDQNCRNTLPIATMVANVFGDPMPTRGATGPDPTFVTAEDQASRLGAAQEVVDSLTSHEGIAPARIVVLAETRSDIPRLCEMMAGPHCFEPFGGAGVGVETIHRFKGLEADAVVLLLDNELLPKDRGGDELLYVAMSRARSLLVVVGPRALRSRLGFKSG